MSYTKLFSSIVHSSLWSASDPTRLLFIAMLAMADKEGVVYGSRSGLARVANISPELAEVAFAELLGPDPNSSDALRSPENEGRRIEVYPGGQLTAQALPHERIQARRLTESVQQIFADIEAASPDQPCRLLRRRPCLRCGQDETRVLMGLE